MGMEYDYIRGNAVVKPNRDYKVHEQKKGAKKPNQKGKNNKQINRKTSNLRKGILQVVGIMTVLSIWTVMRYGSIYKMQSNLSSLKEDIKSATDVGESLRVDLLKYSSLDLIKSKAEKKLGMITPDKSKTVTVDTTKNYFEGLKD